MMKKEGFFLIAEEFLEGGKGGGARIKKKV